MSEIEPAILPPTVFITERAEADLKDHFAYLYSGHPDRALDFFAAARDAFVQLAEMPRMGVERFFSQPRLQGLRMWPIPNFKHYLIFYRPIPDGIEIIRVLHHSRNIEAALNNED